MLHVLDSPLAGQDSWLFAFLELRMNCSEHDIYSKIFHVFVVHSFKYLQPSALRSERGPLRAISQDCKCDELSCQAMSELERRRAAENPETN